jgi:PadR family transcriptional regulator AphA
LSLRHAILGVLSAKPMTGYELAQLFNRSVLFAWAAGQPQIYGELHKMAGEGLLSSTSEPRGRSQKHVYDITPTGTDELRRWVDEAMVYSAEKDPARLRSLFLDLGAPRAGRALFERHIAHYEALSVQIEAMIDDVRKQPKPLIQARLARRPKREHAPLVEIRLMALEAKLSHARTEIAWAKRGLRILAALEPKTESRRAV